MTKRRTTDSVLPECDRELKSRKLCGDENRTISRCYYKHVMFLRHDTLKYLSELLARSSQLCNGIKCHREDCNYLCGIPINFIW